MKGCKKYFIISIGLLTGFVLWTIAVCFIDVQIIGPKNSSVGLAMINQFVHNLTGVNFNLYNITDWLGLVPIFICMGFGTLGLAQWIKRKMILKVDFNLLVLGGFYIITIVLFLFFENFIINYRPVLIDGYLEASYPSSTTMLVMCIMPTAIIQFNIRIKNNILKFCITFATIAFIIFMVISRLISGVHWFTDIVGSMLLSFGLVTMYYAIITFRSK